MSLYFLTESILFKSAFSIPDIRFSGETKTPSTIGA
jgi:hypothetical protein